MTRPDPARKRVDARRDVIQHWGEADGLELAPLLVLDPIARFLDAHGLGAGPLRASQLGDGHSNATYLLRRGDERWVLRRPPRPPFPASAHDVLREFRLLSACVGADLRAPRPLAACEDLAVTGAPFYVMEYVEGAVLTTDLPPALDDVATRARIGEELVDALAEIHTVDWRAQGLDAHARPDGYLERQLRLFARLWAENRTRAVPMVDRLHAWLGAHRPESGPPALVHGDFRLGNTVFSATGPAALVAVLDWEMATLGDPLADLGFLTATYAIPGDATGPLLGLGSVTAGEGFPSREALVERYEEAVGRRAPGLAWYQAFALWKAAIFLEGSYGRMLDGTTDDPFFAQLQAGVPELAERAWGLAHDSAALS